MYFGCYSHAFKSTCHWFVTNTRYLIVVVVGAAAAVVVDVYVDDANEDSDDDVGFLLGHFVWGKRAN